LDNSQELEVATGELFIEPEDLLLDSTCMVLEMVEAGAAGFRIREVEINEQGALSSSFWEVTEFERSCTEFIRNDGEYRSLEELGVTENEAEFERL
jgi:hypothetical protein